MNIETLRNYCLSLGFVTEDFPFDQETLVFRVGGKIFLLTNIENIDLKFNVKCDLEIIESLREEFPLVVLPGFHMSKKHWNTIMADNVATQLLKTWIKNSYDLVFNSLSKKQKEALV